MKFIRYCVTVLTLHALLLSGERATCDEPAKKDAATNPNTAGAAQPVAPHGVGLELSLPNLTLIDVSALLAANSLGIDVATPEPVLRAQLGLEEDVGLVVTGALEESVGGKAGIKPHDVIVQLNDQKIGDTAKLAVLLDAASGQRIHLSVLRGGKPIQLAVTPKKAYVARGDLVFPFVDQHPAEERFRIGVTLSGTDEALRAQLRLAEGEGLVVTQLMPDGAAAAAGVQRLDVLIVLDGKRLTTVEAINSQIQEIKDKTVELRLLRSGKELALSIAPRKTKEPASADAANSVILWETKDCQRCHVNPYNSTTLDSHGLLAQRLGAAHSAWTDGNLLRFHARVSIAAADAPSSETGNGPQPQIDALKSQLAEMQRTLAALESAIAPPKPKEGEKKD